MKKVVLIGGGLLVICCLLALVIVIVGAGNSNKTTTIIATTTVSNPNSSNQGTQTAKVGDLVTSGNWQYAVLSVSHEKTITWSNFGNTADATGTWLEIQLALKNIGKENFTLNTFDFYVTDNSGVKYNPSSQEFMYNSYKGSKNLGEQFPPGVGTGTILLFDVNPQATGLQLYLVQAKQAIDLGQ